MELYITFENTTEAIRFGRAAEAAELPGRLVPTPRHIQVSCGLAWAASLSGIVELMYLAYEQGLSISVQARRAAE